MTAKKTIKEAVVVEGRDDTAAVLRAVNAVTIETHGFGMPDAIWPERFPLCRQAFLPKGKALKKGNIGVENAAPEDIQEALEKARCTDAAGGPVFTAEDLAAAGLLGSADAKSRREKLGNLLSIGYGNSKTFLKKLNQLGVTKEEFYNKVKEL